MKDVPGTQEERYAKQAEIYKEMLEACLESGVCKSFTVWGIGDKYSWIETQEWYSEYSPEGIPTLFDDNLKPKPAYFAIRDILAK
jgi:endo-1,4-beta-xylanase